MTDLTLDELEKSRLKHYFQLQVLLLRQENLKLKLKHQLAELEKERRELGLEVANENGY